MKSGKKIGVRRFFVLFLLMVAGLVMASQFFYSFYTKMFNEGMLTDIQTELLGGLTLAGMVGITLFVGIRYVLRIRRFRRIRI